jgi:hypothetical protein
MFIFSIFLLLSAFAFAFFPASSSAAVLDLSLLSNKHRKDIKTSTHLRMSFTESCEMCAEASVALRVVSCLAPSLDIFLCHIFNIINGIMRWTRDKNNNNPSERWDGFKFWLEKWEIFRQFFELLVRFFFLSFADKKKIFIKVRLAEAHYSDCI